MIPVDFAETPQPNAKCLCGHVANNHHGVAWLCWTPNCNCTGFVHSRKAEMEEAGLSGAD